MPPAADSNTNGRHANPRPLPLKYPSKQNVPKTYIHLSPKPAEQKHAVEEASAIILGRTCQGVAVLGPHVGEVATKPLLSWGSPMWGKHRKWLQNPCYLGGVEVGKMATKLVASWNSDFVRIVERGYVAILPTCGPPRRKGLNPQDRMGCVAILPTCGPPTTHYFCTNDLY